jgi:hypothetical protein
MAKALVCDECEKSVDPERAIGWLHVEPIEPVIRVALSYDPSPVDFCSFRCLANWSERQIGRQS